MLTAMKESCGATLTEQRNARRYRHEVLGASLLYVALGFVTVFSIGHLTGFGKYVVALLPALGIGAVALAIVRLVLRFDELQRQTAITSAAFASVFAAVVCPALWFLELAGMPRIGLIWVFPMIVLVFFGSMPYFRRRFR